MKLRQQIYIPILIFFSVLIAGQLGITYVSKQESDKLSIRTQVTAEQTGIRLRDFLITRISRLDFIREQFNEQAEYPEEAFRSTALRIQHELPGFQAINWIDAMGVIRWVTPLNDNLPVVGADLRAKADAGAAVAFNRSLRDRTDTATPHIELVQGGKGFATYLPIVKNNQVQGFINGVFRIEELMTICFGNSIKDFNYEVLLSGEVVFLRGELDNYDQPRSIGRYNFNILGQSWELQIVPGSTDSQTTQLMTKLSLVVTILIAALLAGISSFRIKARNELDRAHRIIESSEAKFRTIFDNSPACLVRYSAKAELTDWNLEAASLLGLEFPPEKRRSIYKMDALKPILPAIEETFEGKHSTFLGSLEIQGKVIDIDASFETLASTSQQIQGGIILIKDVTERNQTNRAREVMYEISELANSIKDLPVLFHTIQKSLNKILDTRNFYVALYDETLDEFTYPYYKDEFDSPPPKPIRGEKGISAYVIKNSSPKLLTKEEFYEMNREGLIDLLGTPSEQWLGCPLLVEGKPIGLMAVQSYSKDVIYRQSDMEMLSFVSDQIALTIQINIEDEKLRRSEAMHRELSDQLSDSNNIKALLLDILSHDLKNPAGVIAGVSDLLNSGEESSDEIQLIKDSSDVLLKVIENTTALARITVGETIAMSDISLSDLVQEVIEEFRPAFRSEGIPLDEQIEQGLNSYANPIIAEIFRNYLSNALKYAPSKKPVEVILKKTSDKIEFNVKDLGDSIPPQDQKKIFQRMVQLENGKQRGSGLGLAIVHQIAEVHQAEAGVETNQPTGNNFYLRVPLENETLPPQEKSPQA